MNSDLILFFLAVGLVLGIHKLVTRVLGGVRADANAIAVWNRLSLLGFWRYALQRVVPFVFLAIFARTLIRHWQESHAFAVTFSDVLIAGLLSVPIGLLAASLRWSVIDSAACDARARRRASCSRQ